jgi:hypothetical protein
MSLTADLRRGCRTWSLGGIDYFCALGAAAMGPLEAGSAKAIAVLTSERSSPFPAGLR